MRDFTHEATGGLHPASHTKPAAHSDGHTEQQSFHGGAVTDTGSQAIAHQEKEHSHSESQGHAHLHQEEHLHNHGTDHGHSQGEHEEEHEHGGQHVSGGAPGHHIHPEQTQS